MGRVFINNQRLAQLAGVDFGSELIQPGPIVYSRTHSIVRQFPRLAKFPSCVLITSFSDDCCTSSMIRRLPSNVRRWFSNNVMTRNPRVTAVPIGVRTSQEVEMELRRAIDNGRQSIRNLMYVNFWRQIPRPINPREGLYEMFSGRPWVTAEGGFGHVPMSEFYTQIASHPYVLSPPGAGPDCHRHWESLLLGSVPVVLRSLATRLLEGLPCLQVASWDEVTEERLVAELPALQARFAMADMDVCWFEYWERRVLAA